MATSFAPKDAGTAKWGGGPATITNPVFKYQEGVVKNGERAGEKFKQVKLFMQYIDQEGNPHNAQYAVGDAQFCQIKNGPGSDADAVDEGPSIASPDPEREYKIYPDSDIFKFMQSLVLGGLSEAELQKGDITVIDGLEVEVIPTKRNENDKFPLYLVKAGSVASKAGAKRAGAKAAGKGNGKAAEAADESVKDAATETVLEAIAEGPITTAKLVTAAMNKYKGQSIKAAVVGLLSKREFYADSDMWEYDPTTKTVSAAE